MTANSKNEEDPSFQITFGGLCSFVEEGRDDDKKVHVLLIEANRSSVRRPRLCLHDRYLAFRASNLLAASSEFYRPVVGYAPDGSVDAWCIWDIDGCDIDVLPNSLTQPISYGASSILNLDPFNGARVNPRWLDADPVGLVGARLRLRDGHVADGLKVKRRWVMLTEHDHPSDSDDTIKFNQTVEHRLQSRVDFVKIVADNFQNDARQTLFLGLKDQDDKNQTIHVTVSNLCSPPADRNHVVTVERDVLAYYDLCISPLPQGKRKIPHLASTKVFPRESACPPVKQSLA